MAKFRKVRSDFWIDPIISEMMTPADRYFYLYLLTNQCTTQIGIYKITIKQIAFDMGYTVEFIQFLMERFITLHRLIRYNTETREIAIKNWAEFNFDRAGKPMMDCITSELKKVKDTTLIQYVAVSIQKKEFRNLYESFYPSTQKVSHKEENNTYIVPLSEEKEIETQQEVLQPVHNQNTEQHFPNQTQKPVDVKEIIAFWDNNGFGLNNINAKEQLLSWLDDSRFLQPNEVILKALKIACANNKRRLSYVVGILKNWENESLQTVEEIDSYQDQKSETNWKTTKSVPSGRDIPSGFDLDITEGEDW